MAIIAVVGINVVEGLKETRLAFPDPRNFENAFFVTAAHTEPAGLALLLGSLVLFLLLLCWKKVPPFPLERLRRWGHGRCAVPTLAAMVIAACAAGNSLVFHDRALTADENMPNLQARIFLDGHFQQKFPARLINVVVPLRQLQSEYFPQTGRWNSAYLPVYAALRVPFLALGLERWANPLLESLSIVILAGIVRKIWPNRSLLPLLGGLFLAASSQFLITGMTAYSMPAHLAFNLGWLWLYLHQDRRRFWLTPFIGVLAMGLHQPFIHAAFAAPFLLRFVWERRWKTSLWFGIIYGAGIGLWWTWWQVFRNDVHDAQALPLALNPHFWLTHGLNLCELLAWTAPPVVLLASLAASRWRTLPPFLQDCAASCLCTFGFFLAIRIDQGFGWGYRYFHGSLGCLVLLAVAGWPVLVEKVGARRAHWLAVSGIVLSASLQIPLRCWQAEALARPFAKAEAAFHQMDVDLVVFDMRWAWYCPELVRNDPALHNRPLIACVYKLNNAQSAVLHQLFPKIHFVDKEEMEAYGLPTEWDPASLH